MREGRGLTARDSGHGEKSVAFETCFRVQGSGFRVQD